MSQNTPVVVAGTNIEGNIGSCEVKAATYDVDSWHNQTIAVNSCTGQVVYQSPVYTQWGYIYVPSVILLVIIIGAISLRVMFD